MDSASVFAAWSASLGYPKQGIGRTSNPSIVLHGCPSMMPGADPLGPRSTHHHSEGQPPFRLLPGGRPITASRKWLVGPSLGQG